jgi:hypothetical protein
MDERLAYLQRCDDDALRTFRVRLAEVVGEFQDDTVAAWERHFVLAPTVASGEFDKVRIENCETAMQRLRDQNAELVRVLGAVRELVGHGRVESCDQEFHRIMEQAEGVLQGSEA